jgi:hypothetical protein
MLAHDGAYTLVSAEQATNMLLGIVDMSGMLTKLSEVQLANTFAPIDEHVCAEKLTRDTHPPNAPSPMDVHAGTSTSDSSLQYAKA